MKQSPCKDCPERFIACSDKCPKDKRGEYGYQTWLEDVHKEQAVMKEYLLRRREDYQRTYNHSKTRNRRGKNNGM